MNSIVEIYHGKTQKLLFLSAIESLNVITSFFLSYFLICNDRYLLAINPAAVLLPIKEIT